MPRPRPSACNASSLVGSEKSRAKQTRPSNSRTYNSLFNDDVVASVLAAMGSSLQLRRAEQVCKKWKGVIESFKLWPLLCVSLQNLPKEVQCKHTLKGYVLSLREGKRKGFAVKMRKARHVSVVRGRLIPQIHRLAHVSRTSCT